MKTTKKNNQQCLTTDQQQLVSSNVEFAMNMGRKFHGRGVSVQDLQQEACLGLCEAALRYDPARDNVFLTYAYNYCLKYIMQAIRHNGNSLYAEDDVELFADTVIDDEDNLQEEYAIKVQSLLDTLTDKERQVVCLAYGIPSVHDITIPSQRSLLSQTEPLGFRQIADIMHLQPMRVKQIYSNALIKLQKQSI